MKKFAENINFMFQSSGVCISLTQLGLHDLAPEIIYQYITGLNMGGGGVTDGVGPS